MDSNGLYNYGTIHEMDLAGSGSLTVKLARTGALVTAPLEETIDAATFTGMEDGDEKSSATPTPVLLLPTLRGVSSHLLAPCTCLHERPAALHLAVKKEASTKRYLLPISPPSAPD